MRALDWRQLLTERGIGFVDRGPNVKRGEINIQCPFCGTADPSKHMGLNLESGFWACWRNKEHRGKSPLRLIVQLLRVSYYEARRIAGLNDDYVDPEGFSAKMARFMARDGLTDPEHVRASFLQYPPDFKELYDAPPYFEEYLAQGRLFGAAGTARLVEYGLRAAVRGDFRGRVIFPYFLDGELVAWTGRAVSSTASVRYRDLEVEDCIVPPKGTLLNIDCRGSGGRALVVVEGPVDALKIDVFGRDVGVRAVALSTNSITEAQIYLLEESAPEFDRVLFMLDNATELGVVDSMRLKQDVRSVRNASIIPTPYGLKDAAMMSPRQASRWALELSKERP